MIIGFDASRAFVSNRTGTENYSYELLKHLLAIDTPHTFRIYLRDRLALNNPILQKPNVETVVISLPRLWTQVGLAYHVLLHKPDVLFIPAHTIPIIRRPTLKTVVTIHDLGAEYLPQYHQFPQKLYLNRSTEYAAKHASQLIAVSQATKHDLVSRLNADPAKITVIYEGFSSVQFLPQSEERKQAIKKTYQLDKPYLLFVGTIQPRKNLVRLIQAFADAQLANTNLVLAGKKGWLSDEIYQAPTRCGVGDSVKFLDYVPDRDLPALLQASLGFVYPSLFEGFGLPILEAMASDVPVLTANVSSMPEVAGNAAVLVDPHSVDDITQGIKQIATDTALRKQLILRGREQVTKFTWQKTASQTLALLEETGGKV